MLAMDFSNILQPLVTTVSSGITGNLGYVLTIFGGLAVIGIVLRLVRKAGAAK